MSVGMSIGLLCLLQLLALALLLFGTGCDILECDDAFHLLASEDCLIVPANKDADLARLMRGGHSSQSVFPPATNSCM